ncbi:MAG: SMC-Scp complex subunit ScpB [Candidatus Eremiobacteraeota bacterium]|nr:SMC-Scp complex subunit ScpB [Candidatus Eremiobacteraeota bacterium]
MQTELVETGALQRSLEALLFVADEALSIERLARLTGAAHVEVAEALARIADDYAARGIVLREIAGGYRFATSSAARQAVEAYLLPPKTNLSAPAMETLAIVAYLQPATKAEIEAVRGVNVDSVVATLIDRRFISEVGRRDVPGRPAEYKTTAGFLEAFGLRSVDELPSVDIESERLELPLPVETEPIPTILQYEPATGLDTSEAEAADDIATADAAPAAEFTSGAPEGAEGTSSFITSH